MSTNTLGAKQDRLRKPMRTLETLLVKDRLEVPMSLEEAIDLLLKLIPKLTKDLIEIPLEVEKGKEIPRQGIEIEKDLITVQLLILLSPEIQQALEELGI